MTCRRAFDLDLPAYLVDPRAAEWTDFRDHWPTCADCAAEVAAWTALQARLGPWHPDAAVLLRWSDGGDGMPAAERLAVARHVEGCSTCTDELRALARFDTAPHLTAAPVAVARRPWTIGRVLWSPAVAYALLLLALLPTLRERHEEARPQLQVAAPAKETTAPPAEPPAQAPAAAPSADREERPADGAGFTGAMRRGSDDAGPQGRARGLGGAAAPAPPPPPAPAPERKAPEPAMAERDERRAAPEATAVVPATRPAPQAKRAAPPREAEAQPSTSLSIPLPDAARQAGVVELRIRDAGGDRELRERFPVHPDLATLSVELPATWTDHTYEVELRVPGTTVVEHTSITVR